MYDAAIIGGGPAGLFAGARLAAAGYRIAILEEHDGIGEPVHCTGVLASEAFAEFGLSQRSLIGPLATARFWSPAGHQVSYTSAAAEAVVIDRRLFDQELRDRVVFSGASLFCGGRVTDLSIDTGGVTARTDRKEIRAQAAILACGASYALHRQVGLGKPRLFLQTAQLELPAAHLGDVELHFGSDVAPKGFGWVVPVRRPEGHRARVGVMAEHHAASGFGRLVERIAGRWGVAASAVVKPRQKILPLVPLARTYRDRLLAVGDAAGLVKPTTGGGIYYSLVSASIAADVLGDALATGDVSERRLASYEWTWRKRLSGELRAQLRLRLIAHRMNDGDIERLFDLARTDGVMPIIQRTASFNRHRKLIVELLKHPPVRQLIFRRLAF